MVHVDLVYLIAAFQVSFTERHKFSPPAHKIYLQMETRLFNSGFTITVFLNAVFVCSNFTKSSKIRFEAYTFLSL